MNVFPDENQTFTSRLLYPQINMTCIPVEGTNTGKWVWYDEGVERIELPKCKVFQTDFAIVGIDDGPLNC